MPSAGGAHTVVLRSDGQVVACGKKELGQCDLLEAEEGVSYMQVCAGGTHTVLLRMDGQVVACGGNSWGQCDLSGAEDGVRYMQVAAGSGHTVLLRSDGQVEACGLNDWGQCDLPEAEDGVSYMQIAAGGLHTVILRSDGRAVACGCNEDGQCDLPEVGDGVIDTRVAAGFGHTLLLRSDGQVVACGNNDYGQCDVAEAEDGVSYTEVAAGCDHTVLLRSDGRVAGCGSNLSGQLDLPDVADGVHFVCIAAGGILAEDEDGQGWVSSHTVLLRCDGRVLACGDNDQGQCELPEAEPGVRYVPNLADSVVQLHVDSSRVGFTATCRDLSGAAVAKWTVGAHELHRAVLDRVRMKIARPGVRLHVLLPDGSLLEREPLLTWARLLKLMLAEVRATRRASHHQRTCGAHAFVAPSGKGPEIRHLAALAAALRLCSII